MAEVGGERDQRQAEVDIKHLGVHSNNKITQEHGCANCEKREA